MRPDRSGSKRGFTLLEALVATAVVAFLLLPVLQSIVTSKSVSKAASRQLSAHLVLDRLLASVPPASGIAIGKRSGADGGFAWTIDTSPLSAVAPPAGPDTGPAFVPYRVRLSLTGGGAPIALETIRLGPAPPPPEQ
jgi:prepilin-type N-terminal cleavage/methylation domain-containing protein